MGVGAELHENGGLEISVRADFVFVGLQTTESGASWTSKLSPDTEGHPRCLGGFPVGAPNNVLISPTLRP